MLRDVCDLVLSDTKASKELIQQRATALKIIGTVYQNVRPDVTPEDIHIEASEKENTNKPKEHASASTS